MIRNEDALVQNKVTITKEGETATSPAWPSISNEESYVVSLLSIGIQSVEKWNSPQMIVHTPVTNWMKQPIIQKEKWCQANKKFLFHMVPSRSTQSQHLKGISDDKIQFHDTDAKDTDEKVRGFHSF